MTIRELAKASGVSTATVSRMLNKNGFVSKEAEDKINAAMKDNDFQSEKRIKRRATGEGHPKQLNFTMLWTSDIRASMTGTGHDIMLGITETMRVIGANLVVDYIDSDGSVPKCLSDKSCDGIFLHGDHLPKHHADLVKKRPAVWLLQSGDTEYGDRVQPDHWGLGVSAYKNMELQGCKNVCCISHTLDSISLPYWHSRLEGFLHAGKFGKTKYCNINTAYTDPLSSPEDQKNIAIDIVDKLEKISPRPDGIFVANALGSYIHAELKHREITPMKDIYMISGDMDAYGQFLDSETVKIDIQGRQIGKLAAEAMLLRIKNPDMDKIKYFTEASLLTP
ncbi:LacI family DNA-binding transcriptional regulator [Lentisphaera profundi]|uniref:LacI family DNA-binding transcriptional regulator n=1 Tax=Lentisphaera profundi TaxID=1658616 RepID=A0ABY7VVG4_9BACT|nr:LacI family DNA-binding transcriptional regulator [Lentisphaera profundi]WDE97283.1 LacI family DNA-binding transcriptional regulator [Lentisphaera profundi]